MNSEEIVNELKAGFRDLILNLENYIHELKEENQILRVRLDESRRSNGIVENKEDKKESTEFVHTPINFPSEVPTQKEKPKRKFKTFYKMRECNRCKEIKHMKNTNLYCSDCAPFIRKEHAEAIKLGFRISSLG